MSTAGRAEKKHNFVLALFAFVNYLLEALDPVRSRLHCCAPVNTSATNFSYLLTLMLSHNNNLCFHKDDCLDKGITLFSRKVLLMAANDVISNDNVEMFSTSIK